jgi:hypothetical protein
MIQLSISGVKHILNVNVFILKADALELCHTRLEGYRKYQSRP